ncbi:MAG: hypothetical protein H7X94_01105 [Vallitaleaceae bacterium]|nr:hypothetical protein [Vallitaleaceae bacterium]
MEFFCALILYIGSLLLSVAFHTSLYFKGQKSKLMESFLLLQLMIFIWIFGKVFIQLSPGREVSWVFTVVQYSSVIYFGNVFLNFAYYYNKNKRLARKLLLLLFGISFFNYGALLTNHFHQLFFAQFNSHSKIYGPIFYFHTVYSYVLIVAAYYYLLRGLFANNDGMKRSVKIILSFGLLLPLILNVVHVFHLTNIQMDITPVMFNVTFLVFGYASYRYKFIDIRRIATHTIFENLQEGILVINEKRQIIKWNQLMQNYVGGLYELEENMLLDKLIEDTKEVVLNHGEVVEKVNFFLLSEEQAKEILLLVGYGQVTRTFLLQCEKMDKASRETNYNIFRLIEITKYQVALSQLEEKNETLALIHKTLSEELSVLKRLTIAKERNRVSKELHDILGHSLTLVITTLEVCKSLIKTDKNSVKEKVAQTEKIVRDGFLELKKSLEGKASHQINIQKLIEEIKKMADEVAAAGTLVEVFDRHDFEIIEPKYYDAIYRMCQEGMTNSVRHGKAKSITIGLRFNVGIIELFIVDDGNGCKKLVKGNGLLGMEQRVKELNGTLSCGSPDGEGFNLHIRIPLN